MKPLSALCVSVLVSGCVAATPAPPAPEPAAAPAPPQRRPDPSAGQPAPTPRAVLLAADQARAEAYGYVADQRSTPEVIDRLALLMRRLNLAVDRMRAGGRHGHYGAADVRAARQAVDALRGFLASRED